MDWPTAAVKITWYIAHIGLIWAVVWYFVNIEKIKKKDKNND